MADPGPAGGKREDEVQTEQHLGKYLSISSCACAAREQLLAVGSAPPRWFIQRHKHHSLLSHRVMALSAAVHHTPQQNIQKPRCCQTRNPLIPKPELLKM